MPGQPLSRPYARRGVDRKERADTSMVGDTGAAVLDGSDRVKVMSAPPAGAVPETAPLPPPIRLLPAPALARGCRHDGVRFGSVPAIGEGRGELVGEGPAVGEPGQGVVARPPGQGVFELVRDQLADILETDPQRITEGSSFSEDLDADSLALIELVEALEEELGERTVGFRIDDEDLEDLRTVRDAVDYVVAKLDAG